MKRLLFLLISFLQLASTVVDVNAQARIAAGPMPGYAEPREVAIWLQTNQPSKVKLSYWPLQAPKQVQQTEEVQTSADKAFCHTFVLPLLEPGKKYGYSVQLNGKNQAFARPLQFQTAPLWPWWPDTPEVTFALGSCAYVNDSLYDRPGRAYGGDYQIFNHIASHQPDWMIWAGDNTYLREADWGSRSGVLHRYSHTRQLPEMQALLQTAHHAAIWDDHDFGPNDGDRGFDRKHLTREAFHLFWPNAPRDPQRKGNYGMFSWADVDFFLLDDRTFKTPNDRDSTERTILGQEQIQWLIDNLCTSKARYKLVVVGSQFLNPSPSKENFINTPADRTQILDALVKENISGVMFLTGDRHFTELSKLKLSNGKDLYDLTCSPLTSGVARGKYEKEVNDLRVEGTRVNDRNFALLKLTGKGKDRKLNIRIINAKNEKVWERDF